MFIKQVIIEGFKSYGDRIESDYFSPGVNVIVGVNGAGKSNFVEAIQFALDAHAPLSESQRLNILHGRPVRECFVQVVLDNSSGRLPLPHDEVRIARHCSADSEWWTVDGRRAERGDVLGVLEAGGLSSSSPFWAVRQHKVTAAASMGDAERLAALEELGGARAFERRRKESARLLEDAARRRAQAGELLKDLDARLDRLGMDADELAAATAAEETCRAAAYAQHAVELRELRDELARLERQRLEELATPGGELALEAGERAAGLRDQAQAAERRAGVLERTLRQLEREEELETERHAAHEGEAGEAGERDAEGDDEGGRPIPREAGLAGHARGRGEERRGGRARQGRAQTTLLAPSTRSVSPRGAGGASPSGSPASPPGGQDAPLSPALPAPPPLSPSSAGQHPPAPPRLSAPRSSALPSLRARAAAAERELSGAQAAAEAARAALAARSVAAAARRARLDRLYGQGEPAAARTALAAAETALRAAEAVASGAEAAAAEALGRERDATAEEREARAARAAAERRRDELETRRDAAADAQRAAWREEAALQAALAEAVEARDAARAALERAAPREVARGLEAVMDIRDELEDAERRLGERERAALAQGRDPPPRSPPASPPPLRSSDVLGSLGECLLPFVPPYLERAVESAAGNALLHVVVRTGEGAAWLARRLADDPRGRGRATLAPLDRLREVQSRQSRGRGGRWETPQSAESAERQPGAEQDSAPLLDESAAASEAGTDAGGSAGSAPSAEEPPAPPSAAPSSPPLTLAPPRWLLPAARVALGGWRVCPDLPAALRTVRAGRGAGAGAGAGGGGGGGGGGGASASIAPASSFAAARVSAVTLEGDAVEARGALRGGHADASRGKLAALRALRDARAALAAPKAALASLRAERLPALAQALARASAEALAAAADLRAAERRHEAAAHARARAARDLADAQAAARDAAKAADQARQRRDVQDARARALADDQSEEEGPEAEGRPDADQRAQALDPRALRDAVARDEAARARLAQAFVDAQAKVERLWATLHDDLLPRIADLEEKGEEEEEERGEGNAEGGAEGEAMDVEGASPGADGATSSRGRTGHGAGHGPSGSGSPAPGGEGTPSTSLPPSPPLGAGSPPPSPPPPPPALAARSSRRPATGRLGPSPLPSAASVLSSLRAQRASVAAALAAAQTEAAEAAAEAERLSDEAEAQRAALEASGRRLDALARRRAAAVARRAELERAVRALGALPPSAFEAAAGATRDSAARELRAARLALRGFGAISRDALQRHLERAAERDALARRRDALDRGRARIQDLMRGLERDKRAMLERTLKGVVAHFEAVFATLSGGGVGKVTLVTKRVKAAGEGEGAAGGQGTDPAPDENAGGNDPRGAQGAGASAPPATVTVGVRLRAAFPSHALAAQGAAAGGALSSAPAPTQQPPRLEALSGGQRSTVALALILALQRVDPSPFYLLDEADAALDAPARARFATLVRARAHPPQPQEAAQETAQETAPLAASPACQFICTTFHQGLARVADAAFLVSNAHDRSRLERIDNQLALQVLAEGQAAQTQAA